MQLYGCRGLCLPLFEHNAPLFKTILGTNKKTRMLLDCEEINLLRKVKKYKNCS